MVRLKIHRQTSHSIETWGAPPTGTRSSIYSYHLQFAFTNAPLGEFINLSPDAASIQPYFGGLFPDEPLPKDGKITLEPEGLKLRWGVKALLFVCLSMFGNIDR